MIFPPLPRRRPFPVVPISVWLLACGSIGPALAQGPPDAYREPNHVALPFSMDTIPFDGAGKESLIKALVAAGRNFDVSNRLRAQAIAVALKIDPVNKETFLTNFQLSRGNKPNPVDGFSKPGDAAAIIYGAAAKLKPDSGDQSVLRRHLIDIAAQLDPDHPEAAYELALLKNTGSLPNWAAVLGEKSLTAPTAAGRPMVGAVKKSITPAALPKPRPGELARTQALVKGLLVQPIEGSNYAAKASQMNATVIPAPGGDEIEVRFNQAVGPMMTSALREVMKHLRERHGELPKGQRVEISFEEQYVPKDGPSAAVACALLLESLVTGHEIDTGFAVTGDMNADGTVQPVGGVDAKIRGAAGRDCNVVAIPKENEPVVSDLLLTVGPKAVARIQIFRLETFDQALDLAAVHQRRSENLRTAIDHFTEVQKVLERPNGMAFLKNKHVIDRLRTVVQLAPHHLSARYLLLKGIGKEPANLSLIGSLEEIDRAAAPLIRAIRQGKFEARESELDTDEFGDAVTNLRRVRRSLDQRTWKCADAILDYATLMRTWVNDRPSSQNNMLKLVAEIRAAGQKVEREYDTLENRPDVREEMMR